MHSLCLTVCVVDDDLCFVFDPDPSSCLFRVIFASLPHTGSGGDDHDCHYDLSPRSAPPRLCSSSPFLICGVNPPPLLVLRSIHSLSMSRGPRWADCVNCAASLQSRLYHGLRTASTPRTEMLLSELTVYSLNKPPNALVIVYFVPLMSSRAHYEAHC